MTKFILIAAGYDDLDSVQLAEYSFGQTYDVRTNVDGLVLTIDSRGSDADHFEEIIANLSDIDLTDPDTYNVESGVNALTVSFVDDVADSVDMFTQMRP